MWMRSPGPTAGLRSPSVYDLDLCSWRSRVRMVRCGTCRTMSAGLGWPSGTRWLRRTASTRQRRDPGHDGPPCHRSRDGLPLHLAPGGVAAARRCRRGTVRAAQPGPAVGDATHAVRVSARPLPAVWPSASARVAGIERARMVEDVVKAGLADDGDAWLDRALSRFSTSSSMRPTDGRPSRSARPYR
jgi:hypothetical protein